MARSIGSIPDVLLVEIDFELSEEGPEFVLKRDGLMVFALIADVVADGFDLRLADREGGVAALPME